MKKLFVVFLFLMFYQGFTQQKYKLEYDFMFYPVSTGNSVMHHIWIQGGENTIIYEMFGNQPRRFTRDEIIISNGVIESFYYYTYYYDPAIDNACDMEGWIDPTDYCNFAHHFPTVPLCFYPTGSGVLVPLQDITTINDTSTPLSTCESKTIQVTTMEDCEEINMSYSVVAKYFDSSGNEVERTILPYEKHNLSFSFDYSDISGLSVYQAFRIQVNYVENPSDEDTDDYSVLSYSGFLNCSPEVTNVDPVSSSCSNSSDGSVVIDFNRDLRPNEELRFTLNGITAEGLIIPEQDYTAYQLENETSVSWPANLGAGSYHIDYQSFMVNGGTEIPSITGDSFDFSVSSPSPVTFTTSVNQPSCGSDTGTITVNASGGNNLQQGSYQYSRNNGNTWQDSNEFTGTQGSSHTIRARINLADGNWCVSPDNAIVNINTVSNPLNITSASVIQQPTYVGATNGEIFVEIANGNPPFRYEALVGNSVIGSVNTSNRNATLTGLGEGNYTVRVFDNVGNGNQCSDTYNNNGNLIILEAPEGIRIEIENHENISCNNENDGTITVTVTGGWLESGEDYIYEWRNSDGNVVGNNSPTISSLGQDTYTITVTDSNNDLTNSNTSASESIEILNPAPIQITSVSTEDISCYGAGDGQITVTVSGGTPPFKYRLGNGNAFTELPDDIYTWSVNVESPEYYLENSLEIRDVKECSIFYDQEMQINEPDAITVTENQDAHVDNNIYGGSIGELEIEVEGGISSYAYSWTRNGDPFTPQTGLTATHLINLPAGVYQVIVTNDGCSVSLTTPITIAEPNLLEITSAIPTHVDCFGASTGSIALTVTGGMPPYQYHWSKSDDDDFSAPNTNEITGLSQGTYEVTVTDTDSPATTSTFVVINQQPQVQITHTQEDNICYNDNQGSIDLTVTGGVAPYTYLWSNGETTQDISGLQTGPYTVEVTDALGCTSNHEVTIGQPDDAVGLIFDVTQITAYQYNNGAIDITVTGGEPPYVYEWIANNGFTSANEDISGLAPGDYTLIVYDANYEASESTACTIMEEFKIREPGELLVNISEEYSLFCYGDQNGELLANVTGGVTTYSYQWYRIENGTALDQNIQSPFITDIGQGLYRVTVTDAHGIEVTSEDYDLSHPEELVLQTISTTNVLCYGEATGAIDMQVSGGVLPYTITWNDGATTLDRDNLTANSYTITVEDGHGCKKETTVEIIHPYQELRIDEIEVTDVTRFDGSDGNLSVAFSGGASPHSITWTRESTQTIQGNTPTITNLMAGDYTLVIADANGCSISQTYSVTEPDIVEATLINPTCAGLCDARLSLAILERPGNYTYTWNTGSTSSSLTGLCAGTYTVSIGGFGGRILERTYEIIDPDPLVVDLGEDRILCQGQTHSINAAIADAGAQYQWTSETGFSSTSPQVELAQPGTYSLTVTNSLDCIATDAITISRSTAVIGAEFAVSSQVFTGESVVLVDLSNPTPDVLEWSLPEGAEVVASERGYAEVVFKEAGEYIFGMYTELGDCQAYQEKRVVVIEREKFSEEEDDVSENQRNSFIENYVVYPNPSDGAFTLEIGLSEEKQVSVRVFGLVNNAMVDYRTLQNKKDYLVEYDLRHVSAGVYFVVLETPVSTQVKKLIIE